MPRHLLMRWWMIDTHCRKTNDNTLSRFERIWRLVIQAALIYIYTLIDATSSDDATQCRSLRRSLLHGVIFLRENNNASWIEFGKYYQNMKKWVVSTFLNMPLAKMLLPDMLDATIQAHAHLKCMTKCHHKITTPPIHAPYLYIDIRHLAFRDTAILWESFYRAMLKMCLTTPSKI